MSRRYLLGAVGAVALALSIVGGVTLFDNRSGTRLSEADIEARMADATDAFGQARYQEVAEILAELATAEVPLAQYRLGMMHQQGLGVPHDTSRAIELLDAAAAQGMTDARDALVQILIEAAETSDSLEDGVPYYEHAASVGDVQAKAVLGSYYFSGQVLPQDLGRGLTLLREAAEGGDVRAQSNLGYAYRTGTGVARDDSVAFRWYLEAAEAGMVRAQAAVGLLYEEGAGTERNLSEAVRWYLNAYEAGAPGVAVRLGRLVASDEIQAGNHNEAADWVTTAARAGDTASIDWIQRQSEAGDVAALYALATMYDVGEGVPQNSRLAAESYRRAAERGSPPAQLVMARRMAAGENGDPDYVMAHVWANLAAANGVEGAAAERDVFAQFLSPSELTNAQDLAASWRPVE
ncbi:SEL1-like repeat protein [Maricaulis sp.]|uniref:tetratricopeptide repeat protein n=1 Tax=Maricaulis sp. TaxID=1486257 RepID=UPI002B2742B0|nr:SEL1-like repeat protein [Maricaulis sp.]